MITKTMPFALIKNAKTDPNWIFDLQIEQRIHDDRHHPDVSRLSLHHRMNHLALHFAKYAGRIADASRTGDHRNVNQTLVDTFIIALSAANVLNVRLDEQLNVLHAVSTDVYECTDLNDLLLNITSAAGKLARACEAIDHLEARPLRDEMSGAVVALACTALAEMVARNFNITESVHNRLAQVRKTKIFDGTY